MTAILALIPARYHDKAKAIVAALGFVLTVLTTALPEVPDWLTYVVAVASALGVYGTPSPGYVAPSDAADEDPAGDYAERF